MGGCFGVEIMPGHVHLFLNCPPVWLPTKSCSERIQLSCAPGSIPDIDAPSISLDPVIFLLDGRERFKTQQSNATSPSRKATDDSSHP